MGVIKKAIKPMFKNDKWHIVRGDTVKLLCGKDKGQVGTVLRVFRDDRIPRVLVGGLNLVSLLMKLEDREPLTSTSLHQLCHACLSDYFREWGGCKVNVDMCGACSHSLIFAGQEAREAGEG